MGENQGVFQWEEYGQPRWFCKDIQKNEDWKVFIGFSSNEITRKDCFSGVGKDKVKTRLK